MFINSKSSQHLRVSISIFLILFMMLSLISPNIVYGAAATAKLSEIKGEVFVKKAGGQKELKAVEGMLVSQGDWIRTGQDSSVMIVYENGTETVLAANTQITINTLTADSQGTQSSIKLWAGNVWNKVKSLLNIRDEYEVETPTAVIGVRGTLYLVTIDPLTGETRVEVVEGVVAGQENTERVGTGQEYLVTMGEQLSYDTSFAAPPAKQAIELQRLVEEVEPRILAKIMLDITERVNEIIQQAQNAQSAYDQTQDVGQIQNALALARRGTELAQFAESFVSELMASEKAASVDEVLQEQNTDLNSLSDEVKTSSENAQKTETEVRDTAGEVLTEDQIEDILAGAVTSTTPPTGTSNPPTPSGPPAPPTPPSGGSDEDDDEPLTPIPSNSTISISSATFDKKAGQQADIVVVIDWKGNTLSSIKKGETTLSQPEHYSVSGNQITLKKEYLSSLSEGEVVFTFNFSGGNPAVLKVNIIDTTEPPIDPEEPNEENSEVASVDNGDGSATIMVTVRNGTGDGIEGLKAADFAIWLNEEKYVVSSTPPFQSFTEVGGGAYTFVFNPGFAVDALVEIEAKGIQIGVLELVISGPATLAMQLRRVSAGDYHSLAVQEDGTVLAWGYNGCGQIGNGEISEEPSLPVKVAGLTNVVAVAAGYDHSIALKEDGTVWSWGANYSGQLGLGIVDEDYIQSTPAQIPGLENIVAIDTREDHNLALNKYGQVFVWGANYYGQLGIGTTEDLWAPVLLDSLANITAIAAGDFHSLAVDQDGRVWAWGDNIHGQAGKDPSIQLEVHIPELVAGFNNAKVVAVAAGYKHSLALTSEGTVYAWGFNRWGQVGGYGETGENPNPIPKTVPYNGSDLTGVSLIEAGDNWSFAIKDGILYAWGNNECGQLGYETVEPGWTSVVTELGLFEGKKLEDISGGYAHSLAILEDGTYWAWGSNRDGQLGVKDIDETSTPIMVTVDWSIPFAENCGVKVVDNENGSATITVILKNSDGNPIGHLSQELFTVKLGEQRYTVGELPMLNDFSEIGNGIYRIKLNPGYAYDESAEIIVNDVSIVSGLPISIEEPTKVRITGIELASVNSEGEKGDDSSNLSNLSKEGRFVAFASYADNLAPGVNKNIINIFVRDRETGITQQVNVTSDEGQGTYGTSTPIISDNGKYVVFSTKAQLVAHDTNGQYDIYVRNLDAETPAAGTTVCISIDESGSQITPGWLNYPTISADGRYIAYVADNLLIFVHDRDIDEDGIFDEPGQVSTELVTVTYDEMMPNANSYDPVISKNGRFVVFTSGASNLVPGGNVFGVFVRDLVNDTTTFIAPGSSPDISADGRFIVFTAYDSAELVPGDNNGEEDVFVIDRDIDENGIYDETGFTYIERITLNEKGEQLDNWASSPKISADGRYIVYYSHATNIVEGATSGLGNVYFHDRLRGITKLLSANLAGEPGNSDSYYVAISADGNCVTFTSDVTNLFPNDPEDDSDVIVVDLDLKSPFDTEPPVFSSGTGLNAVDVGPSWVKLEWNEATDNYGVTKYALFRSAEPEGLFEKIVTLDGLKSSYWDVSLTENSVYYYYVLAGDDDGNWSEIPIPLEVSTPPVPPLNQISVPIAAGSYHSLMIADDGRVMAWGDNSDGQLGYQTMDDESPIPNYVAGPGGEGYLTEVVAVAASGEYSVALKADGTVWTWGNNGDGQLGIGKADYQYHLYPTQVKGKGGVGYLTNIAAIAAGEYHVLALDRDGTVWSWGSNNDGSLGNGTEENSYTPARVKSPDGTGYLTNVVAIAAGDYHSVALRGDGTVWTWGDNYSGQLGDGTTVDQFLPQQVPGLSDIKSIAAGQYYSLAIASDNTVLAWGNNYYGELGDGTSYTRTSPVKVKKSFAPDYLDGIIAVAGGEYSTLAIDENGKVWAWGSNYEGQLGLPTDQTTIAVETALTKIAYVTIGDYHALALEQDGTLWAFGDNRFGQLGISITSIVQPYNVTFVNPDMAYDSVNERYLMVYEKFGGENADDWDIYGVFVDKNGSKVDAEFLISDTSGRESTPKVAYNLSTQKFLVVWSSRNEEDTSGESYQVKSRLVDAVTRKPDENSMILTSSPSTSELQVDVASSGDKFLAVWGQEGGIHGYQIDGSGNLGPSLIIEESGADYPAVAYGNGKFVVTYEKNNGTNEDVKVTFVDAMNMTREESYQLARSFQQIKPEIVYGNDGLFLVAWQDFGEHGYYSIAAQMVNEDGFMGTAPWILATGEAHFANPMPSFSPVNNEFLIVFQKGIDSEPKDILGSRVFYDGSTWIPSNIVAGIIIESGDQENSVVLFDPSGKVYFVIYGEEE